MDKAEQWSENPVDVAVEPGKFSAKHHAQKAEESAAESKYYHDIMEEAAVDAVSVHNDRLAVDAAAAAANQSKLDAQAAENNAAQHEITTNQHRLAAEGSDNHATQMAADAEASALAAHDSELVAINKAQAASDSQGAAALSEANASASEEAAALSEANADQSEAQALAHKNAAGVSEVNAKDSENKSKASELKAQKWAEEGHTVEVEPGKFSAKHWATVAANAVGGAMTYMGVWDASSGEYPTTPFTGHYYKVSVAGTIGAVDYQVNDSVIYNGTTWDKIDNSENDAQVEIENLRKELRVVKALAILGL
jgi:hypothetical protein